MALDTRSSVAARNAALAALTALLNGGFLRIYTTGSGRPAGPATAITDQVLLAELALSDPAFGTPVNGAVSAEIIADDDSANATGTATWARWVTSGGVGVLDIEVGTAGANLNLNSVNIQAGARVSVSSYQLSQPSQGA